MIRRNLIKVAVVTTVMAMMLCGCGKKSNVTDTEKSTTATVSVVSNSKNTVKTEDSVNKAGTETVTITDAEGNTQTIEGTTTYGIEFLKNSSQNAPHLRAYRR